MKKLLLLLSAITVLFSCTEKEKTQLSDYIPVTKIDSVVIYNNSGKVILNEEQRMQFIKQLKQLKYECDGCVKLGTISANFWIDSSKYGLETSTHGTHFDVYGSDVSGVFTAKNINLDN